LFVFVDANIQPLFEFANFIKDIFKIFSKVLIIKEKKQQLTAPIQNKSHQNTAKIERLCKAFTSYSCKTLVIINIKN